MGAAVVEVVLSCTLSGACSTLDRATDDTWVQHSVSSGAAPGLPHHPATTWADTACIKDPV